MATRRSQRPRRGRSAPQPRYQLFVVIRAYLVVAFLIILCGTYGLLMTMQGTVTFISCQRDQRANVNCSAQARVLGILSIRAQAIGNVRQVEAVIERRERVSFKDKIVDYYDLLQFKAADGSRTTVHLSDGWKFGTPASQIEQRINAMVQQSSQQTLELWHGSLKGLVFLLFGLPVLAVSLVMLGAVVYGHYRVCVERS